MMMRMAHILSLTAMALLLPLCLIVTTTAFTTVPRNSFSRGRNKPSCLVRLDVSTDEKVSSSGSGDSKNVADNKNDKDENWWKTYQLPHANVAQETRPDFPILNTMVGSPDNPKPLIYLDSGATSQKPKCVIQAIQKYYETQNSNVHRGAHSLSQEATSRYEEARDIVQNFIHAPSRNEVVFTSGATEAINLIAQSYARTHLQSSDEILLTVMEHHSNLVPWQLVAQMTGATLKFIPINPETGALDLDEMKKLLSFRTKIVAFQHVSNVMGCINPVQEMAQMIRQEASPDVKIVLDACQSIPHLPVNVQTLGVDFLVASGHKACGPTGIGFLWAHESLLNGMPPYMGGGEMIDHVTLTEASFAPAPARFEAGTPPIEQAIGLGAALQYLEKVGMDRIEQYEHELAEYLYKRLDSIPGITILGPTLLDDSGNHRAALCAFVCDNVHPSDLSTFLDMEGVAIRAGHHCCQPLHQELGYSHSARASLYFYNTKEDVDAFVEKLQSTLEFFGNLEGDSKEEGEDEFVPFI